MKITFSAIVACLAGAVAASPISASSNEKAIVAREGTDAKTGVKFLEATMANDFLVEQPIVGTTMEVNKFINGLEWPQLEQILGNDYGYPFCLYFYEITAGSYLGNLCGHFTTQYTVVFDSEGTRVPGGSRIPNLGASKQYAPQPVRVTANARQSQEIISSGTVTQSMLRELLGGDYGKPFIIIIEGSNSGGEADGSVTSSGRIVFDPSTEIPDNTPPPPTQTNPPNPQQSKVVVYANEEQSRKIIEKGSVSDDMLRELLGKNYGKPFTIIIQGPDSGGEADGYFTSDGKVVFTDETQIPDPPKAVTIRATQDQSNQIIKDGKISEEMLRQILGSQYGQVGKTFSIVLTGSNSGGVAEVIFKDDGTYYYGPNTNIPKPPSSTPDNSDAPAGSNTGSVQLNANGDQLKSQLNNLSYDYILKATGGKYGAFYITFTSADGKTTGYIQGSIQPNGSYNYKWATKYKS